MKAITFNYDGKSITLTGKEGALAYFDARKILDERDLFAAVKELDACKSLLGSSPVSFKMQMDLISKIQMDLFFKSYLATLPAGELARKFEVRRLKPKHTVTEIETKSAPQKSAPKKSSAAKVKRTRTKEELRELTLAGMERARQQGKVGGRSYKLTPHQRKEIVRMITSGERSPAYCARLWNVHPSNISRLVGQARINAAKALR